MKVTFYKTIDNDSGLVLRINIPGLEIYPVSWTTNDFTVTNTFRRAVPIKNKRFYDNNQGTLMGKSAWKLSSPFCYDNARTCVVLLSERVVFRFIYLPERCVLRSLTLVVLLPVANRITMRSATFKATWMFLILYFHHLPRWIILFSCRELFWKKISSIMSVQRCIMISGNFAFQAADKKIK